MLVMLHVCARVHVMTTMMWLLLRPLQVLLLLFLLSILLMLRLLTIHDDDDDHHDRGKDHAPADAGAAGLEHAAAFSVKASTPAQDTRSGFRCAGPSSQQANRIKENVSARCYSAPSLCHRATKSPQHCVDCCPTYAHGVASFTPPSCF